MMGMTDKQIQTKLDKIASLINELDSEIKSRHGRGAFVYFEAEGMIHLMSGDDMRVIGTTTGDRSDYSVFSSKPCRYDCGGW